MSNLLHLYTEEEIKKHNEEINHYKAKRDKAEEASNEARREAESSSEFKAYVEARATWEKCDAFKAAATASSAYYSAIRDFIKVV